MIPPDHPAPAAEDNRTPVHGLARALAMAHGLNEGVLQHMLTSYGNHLLSKVAADLASRDLGRPELRLEPCPCPKCVEYRATFDYAPEEPRA